MASSATGLSRDGESMGDEKESRYRPIKKSSFRAQKIKRTVYIRLARDKSLQLCYAYPAVIVEVQDFAPARIHILMALVRSSHGQRRVHMHIMTRQIDTDQGLEDDRPARPGGAKEDKQTGSRASVSHHVQDCSERGGLVIHSRSITVERVQKARHAVEKGACARVQGHVV